MIKKLLFSVIALFLFYEGFTQCNTSFDKGLDFDGSSSDYSRNKTTGDNSGILRRDTNLNSGGKAQPWAFGVVFNWDGTSVSSKNTIWSNAHISTPSMYIKAYITSGGELAFKYGDDNNYIIRKTSSSFISSGVWYGLYIDYDGYVADNTGTDFSTQYSSFRIRLVDLSTGTVSSPSLTNSNNGNGWTSNVNNRIQIGVASEGVDEFDGKISSVVVTTLAIDQNVSDEEISAIILNPSSWLCNYKVGESYRRPNEISLTSDFALEDEYSSYSTRVWLMGDGSDDDPSYIRNQVNVSGTSKDATRLNINGDNSPVELITDISGLTIPPNVIAASTSDSDSNGEIDQILVTLSEDITDGSSTLDNTTFTVAGYTVSGTTTGSLANDNQVLISLTESGSVDTEKIPNVILISGKISDGSNALGYNQTFTGTTDGAIPTISSVSLNAANTELTVTFAEDVYNTNGGSGDLEVADFALSISGGAAGVNATPASIAKTAQNIWVLGLTLTGGTANGGETLTVVPAASTSIYDKAGNAASTSQSGNTASLTEKILPTITDVTSTTGNGSYKQGQTIAITVEFSEAVNVTGTPQLTLETGGSDAVVDYSSGTGSTTLTFNYTIGSGETSGDLDYESTSSLALNSGTIKDAALNAATLTLATPGDPNSLGANKDLIVDTTVPTVTGVTSTTGNDSYKQGETIAITVVFSEVVNVTGTPQLTLETGGSDAVVDYSSGTGSTTLTFNYTIGSGETSGDLDYESTSSLALNSGTIKDAALNAATLTLASPGATNSLGVNKDLIVDTSVPTISSVSLNAANTELTVTFAEDVYNTNGGSGDLEVADFALSISGGAAGVNATPASITKTAQNIWVLGLTLTGGTANGSETLTVNPAAGTAIYDKAGNAASTSQSNNTASLTEKILPTITDVTSTTGNGSYKQGQTIAITVEFSEAVNVDESGGTPTLTLNNTSGTNPAVDYSSGSGSTTLTFNYTIGSGETSSDLDYESTSSLALNSGTIKDAALNAATLTLATPGDPNSLGHNKALIVDTSVPTLVSAVTRDNNLDGTVDRLVLTFSEQVDLTSVDNNNFTLTESVGGSSLAISGSYSSSDQTTVTLTLTGVTANNTSLTISPDYDDATGTIKDNAGNEMSFSETVSGTDGASPAMLSAATGDSNTNGSVDQIVITFSEQVDLSNVDNNNFTLTESAGGSSLAVSGSYSSNNQTSVTLNLTGVTANNTSLTISPDYNDATGTIIDNAGNEMSFSETVVGTDGAVPVFSSITPTENSSIKVADVGYRLSETIANGSVTYRRTGGTADVSSPHAVSLSGSELNLGVRSLAALTNAPTLTSGATYMLEFNGTDLSGNVGSELTVTGIVFDGAAPTFIKAWQYDTDGNGNIDEIVLELSEAVSDASVVYGDFALGSGSITGFSQASGSSANSKDVANDDQYITLEVSVTGSAAVSVSYTDNNSGNDLEDLAGNDVASNASITTDDQALPAILSTSWQDTDSDGGIDRAVLTFSESIDITDGNAGDGFGAILVNDGGAVTIDNADYAASNVSSLTLNFLGDEITGTAISGLSITYDNSGSNAIKDKSSGTLEIGDNIVSLAYVDAAKPAILSAVTGDNNADGTVDRLTLTFSESVVITDGGTDNDITLTGSSGSPVITAGTYGGTSTTLTYVIGSSTADNTSLTITPIYAVSGAGSMKDASNNEMANGETVTGTDGAGPAIITAVTSDADANGKIDQIDLTFSENVDDSQGADLASNSVTLGSSYVVSSINTGATGDDAQLRVVVTEAGSGVYDTELTPTVTLVQSKIGDGSNNQATTNQGAFTPSDGAAPVIVSTSFTDTNGNGSVDRATLTFSEVIDVTDGNAGDGLDVTLVNDGSVVTLDNANYLEADNSGNSTLALNFTGDEILGSNISSSTVTYASGSNAIKDESSATNEVVSQASLSYVDGGVPVITDASWQDADANGKIDRVVLTFSEAVNIVDGNGSDGFGAILIDDGGAVTLDNSDYAASSVTSLTLNFSGDEIASTAISGLSVTYEDAGSNSISDASNEMADGDVAESYTDAALPAILSTSWQDTDSDGGIDRAVLTFSESIDITDGNDGFGAILVNDGGAVTIDNADYAASNVSSLTLNFLGDEITGTAISGLSITYDNSGSNDIKDRSSGTLEIGDNIVSLAYVDAAKPAILSAVTGDNNADGTVDRLTLTFSESVVITDGGTDNDITLTGSSGSPVITDGTYGGTSTTLTYLIGSSTADNTSLTITPIYAVSGAGSMKDASNNEMANGETVTGTDGAGPAIITAVTSDADANGKIDQIDLTFSENVDDSQGADLASNSVTLGSSYVVSSINTGATGDDAQLRVVVTEVGSGVYDTELTPTVTLVQSKIADGSNNQATTNQGAFTPSDGAAPVIVSAQTMDSDSDGKIDRIDLTFSENLDDSKGSNMNSNSFTLGSSYNVSSVATGDTGDDKFLRVNLTEKLIVDSDIKPTITMNAGKIADPSNNMTAQSAFTPTDAAKPIITNARWQDAQVDELIDRVSLTFSEPVNIVDGNSGDGFGAILVNDGSAVTIDNADYSASGVINLNINFSGDQSNLTAGASGLSATYEDSGANSIKDLSGNEITDGGTAFDYTERMLTCMDNEYIALQNSIVISESSAADFADAGTLIFTLSSNFAFEPVGDATSIITDGLISGSDDIAITAATITSSTITITYTNDGNASGVDKITIGTGLNIKYTGSDVTAFGTLIRTGGTVQINGVSTFGFNILDLEVESVDPLTTITSGSPTDGQVLLLDLDICKGGLFDTNYSSLANATANFSIKVDSDPSSGDAAPNTIKWYSSANPNASPSTQVLNTTSFDGSGDATVGFADLTHLNANNAGNQNIWITQTNTRGCESAPIQVVATIYDSPDAEAIAGFDFDDATYTAQASVNGSTSSSTAVVVDNNIATITVGDVVSGTGVSGTVTVVSLSDQNNLVLSNNQSLTNDVVLTFTKSTTAYSSVCGGDQITLGNTNNGAFSGYTFSWNNNDASYSSTDANPITLAPANTSSITDLSTYTLQNFYYYLDVSDANGCKAPINASLPGSPSTNRQAAVKVVVDRPVFADIFSKNGLTFSETQVDGQPIYGDFGSITEAAPLVKSTAKVNGAISGSKNLVVDGNSSRTIIAGDVVTGTGISGNVTVTSLTSQNNLVLSSAQTLIDDVTLTFTADVSLVTSYNSQPYSNRGTDYGTYSGSFSGEGLGVQHTSSTALDSVSFTPYTIGLTSGAGTEVTYTLTENFTGCSVNVTETIKVVEAQGQILNETEFPKTSSLYINKCIDDISTPTATVNGTINSSTNLAVDGQTGIIAVGDIVSGTGITGNVKIISLTDQNTLVLSSAQSISDNVVLTFTKSDFLLVSVNGTTNNTTNLVVDGQTGTIAVGDIVTGTGIAGTVTVASLTDQNNLILSSAQSLTNDAVLTFTKGDFSLLPISPDAGFTFVSFSGPGVTSTISATASVNGGPTGTTALVVDTNVGTINVGDVISGAGISGVVTVASVTNQNNLVLSSPQSINNNVALTFTNASSFKMNMNAAFDATAASNYLVVNANGTHTAFISRTIIDNTTQNTFVDGTAEIIITPLPVITLVTTSDNPLESYYCDVDADNNNQSVDFNMTLFSAGAPAPTKNDVNPLAYTLEVIGPAAADNFGKTSTITVSGDGSTTANIDLAAIISDGTIGLTSTDASNNRDEIKYRLTVSSVDANDPLNTSGPTNTNFGCDNTATHEFTVFKRQGKPELDLSNQSVNNKLVNEISADNYLVEYCYGETIQNVKVVAENAALATSINWYRDEPSTSAAKDVVITPPDDRNIAPFILFGTNTPAVGTYVFNFTQTSNIISGTYAGCESDYSTLTIVIHDIPNAPRLDLSTSSKGDEQTIGGTSGGYYAYEYCEGETIENLNILVGGISDSFIANPALKENPWIFGSGGSFMGSDILVNAGGTIQSEALIRVNKISFKAKSSTGASTTLEVRYFSNSSASEFETLGTIITSNTNYSTYTYTIEEFNDPSVTSKNAVIKFVATNAAARIDDFVASPIIDNVSFYEWFRSDSTLIDGMSSPGTVQDNSGQGAISAEGNVTANAAELFSSVGAGSDNTPAAGTYTFYVARREDHNASQTQIFEGCHSALTRIDIFVYGIPGKPTGMLTDINVSSGELAYNARILPSDTIGSPGLTNVQYRWYRNATDSKKDATEMFDQTNNSTTTSFGEIATPGEGFIGTGSNGYYQVANTYNTNIYLSQVTNLLNRITGSSETTFEGCESEISDRASIAITIYPVADYPLLGAIDYQENKTFYDDNNDNIGESLELSYQSVLLNGSEEFFAKTFYSDGTNSDKFTWYFSDLNGTRNISSIISTSDVNGDTINASEMLIGGISNDETRYYLLTQTTDIEPNDVYEGSESDGTLLKINIFNVPDAPAEASSANASDPGVVNYYYCEGDTIDAINVISYDEDYPNDIFFYWYASEEDALSQDSTKRLTTAGVKGAQILPSEMSNDDVANDNTTPLNMSGPAQPGTYTFYVTQVSDKKITPDSGFSGDPFFGSEGEPLEFTIYVRNAPVAPAVLDQSLFVCEGATVPTFSVASFDSKNTYKWSDSLNVQLAAGQNLTPQNTNNSTPGFYKYNVTQITDINLNNQGFTGCESPALDLILRISEIPGNPVTTGVYDSINDYYVYEICEGEDIPDFVIDNSAVSTQSTESLAWIWYDQDNRRLNTNSNDSFNVKNYLDLSSLQTDLSNDYKFRVTVTADINNDENFDGCGSNYTDIILRINGLPSVKFDNISDNGAYCVTDDEIIISGGSSAGIDGVGRYSVFKDFNQLGSGLEVGDSYAKLKLDSLHLIDDDLIEPLNASDRSLVGGKSTKRNIYFQFTDIKGCSNTDSVTNIVINPAPAIDFKIDNQIIDATFNTCLNEDVDVFEERSFELLGINSETGAGIGGGGFESNFEIYDYNRIPLSAGISDDSEASAQFTPKDARKNLSLTDNDLQDYDSSSTYIVIFEHTDDYGCTNTIEHDIVVDPKPQFGKTGDDFVLTNKACVSDLLEVNVTLGNMVDSLATFQWTIKNDIVPNQNTNSVSVASDDYNLGSDGVQITVKATSNITGCAWQQTESKSIGIIPDPEFRWENITEGNNTLFSFRERKLELYDFSWQELQEFNFTIEREDGTEFFEEVRAGIDSTIMDSVQVIFDEGGIYRAKLHLISTANCSDSLVREFNILDKIQVIDSKTHTFDEGPESWHTDSISVDGFYDGIDYDIENDKIALTEASLRFSTWQKATPIGATINLDPTASDVPVEVSGFSWITNPSGSYAGGGAEGSIAEHSWVYSPAYDISLLERPTLSFNYSSDLLVTDGVVLQYSSDDGASWSPLGFYKFLIENQDENYTTLSSGLNWYTFEGIPGNPGNWDEAQKTAYNPGFYGWNTSTEGAWKLAVHKIDIRDDEGNYIIPKENWSEIRFRFALGSMTGQKVNQNGQDLEGFAFDNFSIYDRKRIVLVETFGSMLQAESKIASGEVHNRIGQMGKGSLWINYITNIYNDGIGLDEDILYTRNKIDPDARRSYYSINEIPASVLNGEIINTTSEENILGWDKSQLDQKELNKPDFKIELSESSVEGSSMLSFTAEFTSLINLPDPETELSIRFFIVEKLFVPENDLGVYSSTDTIRNVLLKILPNASGIVKNQSFKVDDTFTESVQWTPVGFNDSTQLRLIVMIQNEVTKDIYQAAYKDLENPSNILGIEEQMILGPEFSLFPNPADRIFRLLFERPLRAETDWIVFDQNGIQRLTGWIRANEEELEIDVSHLPAGVYFIQLFHDKYLWKPRRFIIIHH